MAIAATFFVTLFASIIIFNLKSSGKRIDHKFNAKGALDSQSVMRSIGQLLGPPLVGGNLISPLENGDEIFPAMLKAINEAQKTITFETFIYWSGEIGEKFAKALAERSNAGIRVHILLDWIGSRQFDGVALSKMTDAGIQVERYRPLRWYNIVRFNNRTHRKILVIDGRIGFTGGVGIADQWLGRAEDIEHWRDSHYKVEGPVVAQLQAAFMDNWNAIRPEVLDGEDYFPEISPRGDQVAQVFKSSPEEGSGSVRLMYLYSVAHAKKSIRIANAYFVPDSHLRKLLIDAVKRGVEVQVIVPGKHIDTQITRKASRAVWKDLLENNIKIFEFQPTMLHCKYMIVDSVWISVGSTNLDNRSFRLNDECNLNAVNSELSMQLEKVFQDDKARSREFTIHDWNRKPVIEKISDKIASIFSSQV